MAYNQKGLVYAMEEAAVLDEPKPTDAEVNAQSTDFDSNLDTVTDDLAYVGEVDDASVVLENIKNILATGEPSVTAQRLAQIHTTEIARRLRIPLTQHAYALESYNGQTVAVEGVLRKIAIATRDAIRSLFKKISDMIDWFLRLIKLKKSKIEEMDAKYEASLSVSSKRLEEAFKKAENPALAIAEAEKKLKNGESLKVLYKEQVDKPVEQAPTQEVSMTDADRERIRGWITSKFKNKGFSKKVYFGNFGQSEDTTKPIIPKQVFPKDILKYVLSSSTLTPNVFLNNIRDYLAAVEKSKDMDLETLKKIYGEFYSKTTADGKANGEEGYDKVLFNCFSDWVNYGTTATLLNPEQLGAGHVKNVVRIVTSHGVDLADTVHANMVYGVPDSREVEQMVAYAEKAEGVPGSLEENRTTAKAMGAVFERLLNEIGGDEKTVLATACDVGKWLIQSYCTYISFEMAARSKACDGLIAFADTPKNWMLYDDFTLVF